MHKITFTIGIGKRWNGKSICKDCSDTWTKQACRSVATVFGGYTMTKAIGGWVDYKGELIQEESIVIVALGDPRPAREMAVHLRDLFGQECVVLMVEKPEVEFV